MLTWFCFLVSIGFAAPPAACEVPNDEKRCMKDEDGDGTITITDLNDNKFCNCKFDGITLILDKKLTSIPQYAFYKTKAYAVSAQEVTEVNDYAFQNSEITSVSLPKASTIESYAFQSCSISSPLSLPLATTINENAFQFSEIFSVTIDIVSSIPAYAFQSCSISGSLSLPKVKIINNYAFQSSTINSISIPEVTTIGDSAFEKCTISSSPLIPKLIIIGSYSFNCAVFDSINLPKSLTTVNEYAFTCVKRDFASEDDDFRENPLQINFNQEIKLNKIGKYAFSEQKISLNDFPLDTSAIQIEEGIFNEAKGYFNNPLSISIDFQKYISLQNIGENAFKNVNLNGEISINDKIKTIGQYALYTSNPGTITIYLNSTKSLQEFGYNAFNQPIFYLDEKFNNVLTFTNEMKTIGTLAYFKDQDDDKYKIKTIKFDNCNFESIGDDAFKDCSEWTFEGTFSATKIGDYAFYGCTLFNLPIIITTDENGQGGKIGKYAFYNCKNLIKSVTINPVTVKADPEYPTIDNSAFENSGVTTLDLPQMERIGVSAFEGCEKLRGSSDQDLNVKTIDKKAFYLNYLVNFKNIISHEIYNEAFYGCIKLAPTKIQIVPDVNKGGKIYPSAFKKCTALYSTLQIDEPTEPKDPKDEKEYPEIQTSAFEESAISILDFKCIMEKIDTDSFKNCVNLKKSTNEQLEAKVIGSNSFYGDYNLQLRTIIAEEIGQKAFCQCYILGADINIIDKSRNTNTMVLIGTSAFEDCRSLGTLKFNTSYINDQNEPELRQINSKAFLNSGLKGPLTIPNTISEIGSSSDSSPSTFAFCQNLNSVIFESEYLNALSIYNYAFYHSAINGNLVIPDTVDEIGSYAFAYTKISSLTIQGTAYPGLSATKIKGKAFYYCMELNSLTFGNGSLELNKDANDVCDSFRGCNIATLDLGSITKIPKETFYGMTKLNFAKNIPDTLTDIGDRAFSQCSGISQFPLTENSQLSEIGEGAFYKCSKLTSFNFPYSISDVNPHTFYQCTELETIKFNNNIENIKECAFFGCSKLKGSLDLLDNLQTIEESAFQNCFSLEKSLTIPNTVTTINGKAFMGCSSFSGNLIFGRSIQTIGDYAFRDCSGFEGLHFPDYLENKGSLTKLGEGAFYGCFGFKGDLNIPQKHQDNENTPFLSNYVFRGCSGFDGVLNLPKTVTEIPEGAFYGCTNLGGDISSMKLKTIGKYAFYGCSHLSGSVDLEEIGSSSEGDDSSGSGSDSITISEYAFYGCHGLNGELILPTNGKIEIKEHAFDGCSNLKGTLDGIKFTKIKKYGFARCSSLTGQLNFGEDTIEILEYAFLDCSGFSEQLSFIVKSEEDNYLTIGHCAFKGCSGFKKGRLSFNIINKEEQEQDKRYAEYHRYDYFLKIGNDAFDGTKFKNVYYMGRFEPDCDYDIGISKIKGIHTSSNYANKTFCNYPIHKSKLSGGAIAGIVIACIVVVAAIVVLIVFLIIRNKKNKDRSEAEVEMNQDP